MGVSMGVTSFGYSQFLSSVSPGAISLIIVDMSHPHLATRCFYLNVGFLNRSSSSGLATVFSDLDLALEEGTYEPLHRISLLSPSQTDLITVRGHDTENS
jgi:hypothetical protein